MFQSKFKWWTMAIPCICVLIAAQTWSAYSVKRDLDNLRAFLATNVDAAMQLNRRIGYGGMIHNFKNFVLRPERLMYGEAARLDANSALALIDELESNASSMSVNERLSATRNMVITYKQQIEKVQQLAMTGATPRSIDQAVKVDDRSALLEIASLMSHLTEAVDRRARMLEQRSDRLNWLSSAAAVLFALTLLFILYQRENRRKDRHHLASINALNLELANGNRELQIANNAIKQFASMVSHDLKTPLQHISLFTSLVDKESSDPRSVVRIAGRIDDTVQRMNRIINSLLEFTQTSFAKPRLTKVPLRGAIVKALDELSAQIDMTAARIDLKVSGDVRADAELLNRVLHNLLGNSLKYVKPSVAPQIQIDSHPDGEMMKISITDNGIGIEEQESLNVFKPFHRIDSVVNDYEGTGIGLSMAREIVLAHGGEISVDPDYRDGTRITFTLPRSKPRVGRKPMLQGIGLSLF